MKKNNKNEYTVPSKHTKAMSNGADATSGFLSKTIDDSSRGANAKSAILSTSPHPTTFNNTSGLTLHDMLANSHSKAGANSHNRSCDPKGAFIRSSPRNAKQSGRLVQPSASRLLSTI